MGIWVHIQPRAQLACGKTHHHLGTGCQTGGHDGTAHFPPRRLRDLASAIGQDEPVLAYLDDIYILGPDDLALDQTPAFFEERQPSIRLNPAKYKLLALEDTGPMASRCLELAWQRSAQGSGFATRRSTTRRQRLASSLTCPSSTPSFP
jgi:hypothetical protein